MAADMALPARDTRSASGPETRTRELSLTHWRRAEMATYMDTAFYRRVANMRALFSCCQKQD